MEPEAASQPTPTRKRRRLKRLALGLVGALAVTAIGGEVALRWGFPFPTERVDRARRNSATVVEDREGVPLRAFLGRGDAWMVWRTLSAMNPRVIQATLAVEDERFYRHPGVDPISVARACLTNLRWRRVVSGASTITMQVIRLLRPRPRRLKAKLIEAFRAIQLERIVSKGDVLELYLNLAPYGGNCLGVEGAALRYFGKSAKDLTLPEAALIAGLPQAPSRLRPDRRPALARRRRDHVLDRMLIEGFITAEEHKLAVATPVALTASGAMPFEAPHFTQMIHEARPAGGRVRSTLDRRLQGICLDALREGVGRLRPGVTNGAVVVIENRTAAVRALVGSCRFFNEEDAGQVNGATAPRSPGSALKPFIYTLAFDAGAATPATVLADIPCVIGEYRPRNYDRVFRGVVSAREALTASLNVPAVRLLRRVGGEAILRRMRRVGITTLNRSAGHYGLALALGSAEVTLLELTNAYAALARLGVYRPARLIEPDPGAPGERVFSEGAAWLAADCLSDTSRLLTKGLWRPGRRMAWKTGTSNGRRDAWTVAFTPTYTVGVWLGNFDGRPARELVGFEAAAPVAATVLERLTVGAPGPWYPRPASVGERRVCSVSGAPAGEHCAATRRAFFLRGARSAPCAVHQPIEIDDATGARLCPFCRRDRKRRVETREVWPPDLSAWLCQHEPSRPLAPAHFAGCLHAAMADTPPRVTSPVADRTYMVDVGSPVGSRKLLLSAVATSGPLYWFVDGAFFKSVATSRPTFWPLRRGAHRITCADASGRSASVAFVVK